MKTGNSIPQATQPGYSFYNLNWEWILKKHSQCRKHAHPLNQNLTATRNL